MIYIIRDTWGVVVAATPERQTALEIACRFDADDPDRKVEQVPVIAAAEVE